VIRVVTLAREHGSGGREIAERVAEALGWEVLDQRIVAAVAHAAQVPPGDIGPLDERVESWLDRLAKTLWAGGPEGFTRPASDAVVDADRVAALTRRVIEEAAEQGSCVLVGRGAQCALEGRDDVLRVFVYAPVGVRMRRLAARLPAGADVGREIAEVDRSRRAYVRRVYDRVWDDRACYDLMIDARRGIDQVVRTILAAAAAAEEPR
jgi:cytidylate kinase